MHSVAGLKSILICSTQLILFDMPFYGPPSLYIIYINIYNMFVCVTYYISLFNIISVFDFTFIRFDYRLCFVTSCSAYLYNVIININYLHGFPTFPAAAWHWRISWSSWLSWARLPNFWATTAPAPLLSHPPFMQHHCDSIQEIHPHSES